MPKLEEITVQTISTVKAYRLDYTWLKALATIYNEKYQGKGVKSEEFISWTFGLDTEDMLLVENMDAALYARYKTIDNPTPEIVEIVHQKECGQVIPYLLIK